MKNTTLLFCICWLTTIRLFAQNPDQSAVYNFGQWTTDDKTATIFADICNVRVAADAKSEIAGKLTIGTEVKITEITTAEHLQNGISAPWIKIRTPELTGYIWGAALTKGSLELEDGRFALWGLTEIKTQKDEVKTFASLRIAEKGRIVTKYDFEVAYGDRPGEGYLTLQPAPLLEGVQHLITFETMSEACGVYASSHFFLYAGQELHFIGSGYSMGDGGMLHTSRTFEFPYPREANESYDLNFSPDEGHIFRIDNEGGYDDDCFWVETRKVANFKWNGNGMVPYCEE